MNRWPTHNHLPNLWRRGSATIAKKPGHEVSEVDRIAKSVGVRLTPNELTLLRKKLGGDIACIESSLEASGNEALRQKTTREICLSVVCTVENPLDRWGVRFINFFDYMGTALFSVVGTLVAGDIGMNIVGCTLVGCVASLGGGSINAILYGGASSLLGQPGVRWVANPSYFIVAMVASILTFVGWPYYCETQADHYLENVIGHEKLDEDGSISRQVFAQTWKENPEFRKTIRDALPHVAAEAADKAIQAETDPLQAKKIKMAMNVQRSQTVRSHIPSHSLPQFDTTEDYDVYFQNIDLDDSGDIDHDELKKLVQYRFYNGWETYCLDTLGLSSLSIAAVSMSIRLGIHPLIAATSGVTVCFGGLLRDLLCGRNLAIGSQSYAMATGATSLTYIFLRELAIRRIVTLSLVTRTLTSASACVLLRAYEYSLGEPLLKPMHETLENQSLFKIPDKEEAKECSLQRRK